jgi:molybdenum-dependent DNA-binding transcriptional regulator ModE
VPLREAFEQGAFEPAAQAAELSAKLARTIIRAMRSVLEIIVLSSSLSCFLAS